MTVHLSIARIAVSGLAAVTLAGCGSSQTAGTPASSPSPTGPPVVLTKQDATHGKFLVAASNNMTLYTFTHDTADAGTSTCTGGCLVVWPALPVPAGTTKVTGTADITGPLGIITRSDGTLQVTYKGLPLYFFHKDVSPGDVNGVYPSWVLAAP